jgi:hypothetical protein
MLGAAPKRTRADSSKRALVYRADEGSPSKRHLKVGEHLVEILGDRQLIVAHGHHEDAGTPYQWDKAPGEPGFTLDTLTPVTEDKISEFLQAVRQILGADDGAIGAAGPAETWQPTLIPGAEKPANKATKGWFDLVPPDAKLKVVRAALGAIDNLENDSREQWRNLAWALADAERLGATGACDAFREWASRGARYNGEESEEALDAGHSGTRRGGEAEPHHSVCRRHGKMGLAPRARKHLGKRAALEGGRARRSMLGKMEVRRIRAKKHLMTRREIWRRSVQAILLKSKTKSGRSGVTFSPPHAPSRGARRTHRPIVERSPFLGRGEISLPTHLPSAEPPPPFVQPDW